VGLTAARFDMMYAIRTCTGYDGHNAPAAQCELRNKLGVSAPVVSRMLRSLEELGLVTRKRLPGRDGRKIWISLTANGRACICRACRMLIRGAARFVYEAICYGKHRDPWERFVHMDQLESYLRVLRRHFGDRATLYYAWGHPDD
jgi:DNA-binding MarR family transcriptional regulator